VAQVGAAVLAAQHFGAQHEVAAVFGFLDVLGRCRAVKLGQPQPESNLCSDENRSAPQRITYLPGSWQSQ
jgi:hypothetical protein